MFGFMMEHLHAKHTAQASKEGSSQEKGLLGHSPLSLPGTALVMSHQDEGDKVRYQQYSQCCYNDRLFIHIAQLQRPKITTQSRLFCALRNSQSA